MARCLELALLGWGRVAPNPMVGAVVVRQGEVVGEGHHAEFGDEHAEIAALREAGSRASGAVLFVNLEPCSHGGKTPACTEAILKAGIRRVVIGARDPNPEARGGLEILAQEGVEVGEGVLSEQALRLNAPFLWRHATGRPFVALKLAVSLDGRLGSAPGIRSRVTGDAAWDYVHRLRAGHDAIVVGSGTVAADDPLLTVRGSLKPRKQPLRVILDSRAALSVDSELARSAHEAPVLVAAIEDAASSAVEALQSVGVEVLRLPRAGGGGVDLEALLAVLGMRGAGSVLVEGGGRVAAALLNAGLVQRLHILLAPTFLGGNGPEAFPGLLPGAARKWSVVERSGLGEDTLLEFDNAEMLARLREDA